MGIHVRLDPDAYHALEELSVRSGIRMTKIASESVRHKVTEINMSGGIICGKEIAPNGKKIEPRDNYFLALQKEIGVTVSKLTTILGYPKEKVYEWARGYSQPPMDIIKKMIEMSSDAQKNRDDLINKAKEMIENQSIVKEWEEWTAPE